MIEVKNLVKRYRSRTVLDGITFKVGEGEVAGFLGPNGAGKTTTMRILTGYLPPTQGSVEVAGHDVGSDPISVKRNVGYLPEMPPLYDEMTVDEYLTFVGKLKGLSGARLRTRVGHVVDQCGLGQWFARPIVELSRGCRQRVGLAQALIADPRVLILDEPTAGLDPVESARIRSLVRELAPGRTILFSTHILSEVQAVADRIVMLVSGRIAADGTLAQLAQRHPADRYVMRLERSVPDVAGHLGAVLGVKSAQEVEGSHGTAFSFTVNGLSQDLPFVMGEVARRQWPVTEITPSPGGLERLFFSVLEREVAQ